MGMSYTKKNVLFEQFKKEREQYNIEYVKDIPLNMILKANLSNGATKLLMVLVAHSQQHECCTTSQNALAYELNRCVRTIQRYISELKEKGFMEVVRRGKMVTNLYNFKDLFAKIKAIKDKNNKIKESVSNIKKSCNNHIQKKSVWDYEEQRTYNLEELERKLAFGIQEE